DSLGDAAGQTERVTDGEHHVTGLYLARVAEGGRLQPGGVVGADDREVVGRVGADELGAARGGVPGHLDLELRGVARDVRVCDDVALRVEHHAGAEAVFGPDQHH